MIKDKIILALDTTDIEFALSTAKKLLNKIFTIKLGLQFFNAHGKVGIKKFNDIGINNLMLDLKINDIENTSYEAIKSLSDINFNYLTVMALGGSQMINKCKEAAKEINPNLNILAVTILTSLNNNDLKNMGVNNNVEDMVINLANNSKNADGFVCSGNEALNLRKKISKEKKIFCPGVRMAGDNKNDQQRIISPKKALENGADKIIMGRSILTGNPEKNIDKILSTLN